MPSGDAAGQSCEKGRFEDEAKDLGAVVFHGDIRSEATLKRAGVQRARCIIAASDDDLANIQAALQARELNPAIRVVLRLFDQDLAARFQSGFNISTAFSTSYLAAPAFAMSALDDSVVGSFYVGNKPMLTVRILVKEGTQLW